MTNDILNILKTGSASSGIPVAILYSIVMNESGGNPNAHALTSTEDSRGLFQVNLRAHPNANSSQLFNPTYNMNYMLPELKTYYNKGLALGLSGVGLAQYVERYGERPQWTTKVATTVANFYNEYTGGKSPTTDSTTSTGTTSPATTNTSAVSDILGETNIVNGVMNTIKFGAVYLVLLVLLLFGLYMVFVNK